MQWQEQDQGKAYSLGVEAGSSGNTGNGKQKEGAKENLILQILGVAGNST